MKIGFIGLGIMGSRMAANLLAAGFDLIVYNRSREKCSELGKKGAEIADTAAAVGSQADVLFTVLAHPEAVREVASGDNGFLGAMKNSALWVDCSTVHPVFSREMAEVCQSHGIRFLDAPVGGSKKQAAAAELVFMVGGAAGDIETCRPMMEKMGNRVVHVGDNGMGISLKLVVNLLLATTMSAVAEGLAFGESLGINRELLLKVIIGGPVGAPFLGLKKEKLSAHDYTDTEFPLKWMQKDLQMAATAAYGTGAVLPVGNLAKELYQMAIQNGWAEQDFSAISAWFCHSAEK